MKAIDAQIVWTAAGDPNPKFAATKGTVKVLPGWDQRATERYSRWIGTPGDGFWSRVSVSDAQRVERMIRAFVQMTTLDGIDPRAAHDELLKIGEYSQIWINGHNELWGLEGA